MRWKQKQVNFKIYIFLLLFLSLYTTILAQDESFIPYRIKEKWGYYNDNKKTICIPCIYDRVPEVFQHNLAVVKRDGHNFLINAEGKTLTRLKYTETIIANNRQIIVYFNNKYGLIDPNGKCLFETIYDEYKIIENVIFFRSGKHWISLNKNNEVQDTIYCDDIIKSSGEFILISKRNKQGVINIQNEEILPIKYNYIDIYSNNYQIIRHRKKGWLCHDGNRVTKKYNFINPIRNDFIGVLKRDYQGFIDIRGNEVIEIDYDHEYGFNKYGYCILKKGEFYGLINSEGTVIMPFIYNSLLTDSNIVITYQNRYTKVVSLSNGEVLFENSDSIRVINYMDNQIIAVKGEKYGALDSKNNVILPFKYNFIYYHDKLKVYYTLLNSTFKYLDKKGNPIPRFKKYDYISIFNEYNISQVQFKNKWGYINYNGFEYFEN